MNNRFRDKLKTSHPMLGTHVQLNDPRVTELMGWLGYDYIWIDMEHSSLSFREMEMLLMACRAGGAASLVRVSWNDIPHIKRVLEAGPDAVVFPMIDSVAQAQQAIDTCIYPPEGKRGCGPFGAIRYGLDSLQTYIDEGHHQTCRFLQVESAAAIACMEETARIPYVDGFVLGPMDLSGSLGHLGHVRTEYEIALIELAVAKAHAVGLPIGLSYGADDAQEMAWWFAQKFDFVSLGTDTAHVIAGARDLLASMDASLIHMRSGGNALPRSQRQMEPADTSSNAEKRSCV
ncbi:2,4-dihydroxyhept-2-ene-1,7-dioic acid aldolase [Clostridia bacterium]|nr:2,4-dihydroxyhept-2-ene-1,7-dioic acid aldolase [Clostridia bacterium]